MPKFTPPQQRLIEQLRQATYIDRGVIWWAKFPKKRGAGEQIDGRVANALVRLGVLVPAGSFEPGECGEYRLVEGAMDGS